MNATDTDQIVMTDKNTTPDTYPSHPTQKMPPQKTPRASAELKLPWRGLGVWNVYFILKFALAYFSYLNLDVLWNALLLVFLLIPIPYRWLSALRGLAAVAAGAALAYSESWLPPIASLTTNAAAVKGFSLNYVIDFVLDFINWQMVGWAALIFCLWYLLRNCVRITFITICYFAVMVTMPYLDAFFAPAAREAAAGGTETAEGGPAGAAADSKTIEEWYQAFLNYEKERRAELPQGLPDKDTPFDILLLNICSLSNDDLIASQLDKHPVLEKFNIRFDRFNSATSYSGPAAIRLLTGACGQPSHQGIYGERRPECEILNRLGTIGYRQHMMFDHSGEYDSFLPTLRNETGLTADLESLGKNLAVRYMGFDDEELTDTLALLRYWQRTLQRAKDKRTVTFMNLIALHDGNRLPRHGRAEPFKPRAQKLLDDLQTFLRELERSGRKVMVVVVPEHGAAVRGDKIQAPRLRDIPSLRITEVPTMVKFVGPQGLPDAPIHVTGPTSYLAMTTLIGRTLETNFFSKKGGATPLESLVKDLPETNPVSENGQAKVLEYKGQEYLKQKDGDWKPYAK